MGQKRLNQAKGLYEEPLTAETAERILNIMEASMVESACALERKAPMWDVLKQRISALSYARSVLLGQKTQTALSPHPDGDESILACPNCGSGEFLFNEDGNKNAYCGQCGAPIRWDGNEL